MIIKLKLEKIFIVVFFGIFLLMGSGYLFDHKLSHPNPYAYLASDAFQHQVRAQSIKDAGNYRGEPPYIVFGVENAIGYYPPVLYDLSVILSHMTGIEVYDTIYLFVFLAGLFAGLLMYVTIRIFNKNVAIMALPVMLLVFSGGIYTGFTWGHWPAIMSQFFLVGIVWYTSRIDLDFSYIFMGIFLTAAILTHTSEAVFGGLYLGLFFAGYTLINKKIDIKLIKNYIFGGIITFILAFYYLVIFKFVWLPRQGYTFEVSSTWDNPTMYLGDFRILFLFLILGLIISLFFIKKNIALTLFSLGMIIMGNGNYFGFREKAFQLRFLWPIFLSFVIAFGLYWVLKLIIKKWSTLYSFIISILFILAIIFHSVPYVPHYNVLKSPGLMDPFHWEGLNWIAENTETDSRIYFFYGDIYSQDALLRNSKRKHVQIIPQDLVDAINAREIRRIYDTESPGDHGGGAPLRDSFFSFRSGLDEMEPGTLNGLKDICDFDYFVFDKVSRQEVFAQYNMMIANELQSAGSANVVFDNQMLFIMKNNKIGEDCIAKRNF